MIMMVKVIKFLEHYGKIFQVNIKSETFLVNFSPHMWHVVEENYAATFLIKIFLFSREFSIILYHYKINRKFSQITLVKNQ